MAVPAAGSSRLQPMLQSAVQSVQWTYSIFWQLCPQQGVLVWSDGYYNGAIKTRKTVRPMEVTAEEASLQRSQQLRELYDSLSEAESEQPVRRPCAALSPEDLTETEWFYLMCVSFSFAPGTGLPGKAYAKRQHVWLTGANEVDSKVFSRAILAKSARVQTVVCIPLMDGVVELGITDKVTEDISMVQHIKTFFPTDNNSNIIINSNRPQPPPPPKPALSGHSTSNPASSSAAPRFHSPTGTSLPATDIGGTSLPATGTGNGTSSATNHHYHPEANHQVDDDDDDEEEEEEDNEDEDEAEESDSEAETGVRRREINVPVVNGGGGVVQNMGEGEPSELMQLEMSEDIRIGSPDDASNNNVIDESDHHFPSTATGMRVVGSSSNVPRHSFQVDSERRRWPVMQQQQQLPVVPPLPQSHLHSSSDFCLEDLSQEDSHYSQTVSTILQLQSTRNTTTWPSQPSPSAVSTNIPTTTTTTTNHFTFTPYTAFSKYTTRSSDLHLHNLPSQGTPQWLLKYILFTVPFLHSKRATTTNSDPTSPKSRDNLHLITTDPTSRLRNNNKGNTPTPQDDVVSANHVLAERRRREKLNERFIILRSLVPFVTKMDKASILGDTIEYVKQLRRKIQDLETRTRQMENERLHLVAPAPTPTPTPAREENNNNNNNVTQQRSGHSKASDGQVLVRCSTGRIGSVASPGSSTGSGSDKRKIRVVEAASGTHKVKAVAVETQQSSLPVGDMLQVSIIESDALIELQSGYKEGLLLDVMLVLREMLVEVTAVQSSLRDGLFTAELRAKVKENAVGKKASIIEVKRAINQIIPHTNSL